MSCVKVEVTALGSPSLISKPTVSVDVKQHLFLAAWTLQTHVLALNVVILDCCGSQVGHYWPLRDSITL